MPPNKSGDERRSSLQKWLHRKRFSRVRFYQMVLNLGGMLTADDREFQIGDVPHRQFGKSWLVQKPRRTRTRPYRPTIHGAWGTVTTDSPYS